MKKDDVFFSRKEFLNLPGQHSNASVVAQIMKYGLNEHRDAESVDVELYISDCRRTISLELGLGDEYARENAIHKVETLIDVLEEFKTSLKKTAKHQHRLEKKRAKRRIEELRAKKEEAEKFGREWGGYEKREFDNLRALLKTD